jgi:hypothetical protein
MNQSHLLHIDASWTSGPSTFAMSWIQSTFHVNVCSTSVWTDPLLIMTQSKILTYKLSVSTSALSRWTGGWSRTGGGALIKQAHPSFVRSLVSKHLRLSSQFRNWLGRTVKRKLWRTLLRDTSHHSSQLNRVGTQSGGYPLPTFTVGRITGAFVLYQRACCPRTAAILDCYMIGLANVINQFK